MKFTVVSLKAASDELAQIYVNAVRKKAVEEAANRIDKELKHDAHQKGEPLETLRLFVDVPLAVTFSVSVDDRLVTILQYQVLVP